ncbi:MAG: hypothetical protein QOJ35_2700 [Solirubrobacteraceae bacterium]|nr:hypothetical protein [Solirubrobacteraceae bacterium]
MRRLIGVVLAIGAMASPAAAQGPVRPPGLPAQLGDEVLSDEQSVTRVAEVLFQGTIRANTWATAKAVGRLRRFTEDRENEIYLVLASHVDKLGRTWLRVRIPGRPNGRTGWALADNFGELRVVRTRLRINRGTLRATLYLSGRVMWSSPIGVGAPGTPTPAGHFYIRERLRNLDGGNAIYGPWAFGTSAYSSISDWPRGGVVGIHGTNQPQLIPGRPSHGCIRVPNAAIRVLARILPLGTPVEIV